MAAAAAAGAWGCVGPPKGRLPYGGIDAAAQCPIASGGVAACHLHLCAVEHVNCRLVSMAAQKPATPSLWRRRVGKGRGEKRKRDGGSGSGNPGSDGSGGCRSDYGGGSTGNGADAQSPVLTPPPPLPPSPSPISCEELSNHTIAHVLATNRGDVSLVVVTDGAAPVRQQGEWG